MSPTLFDAHVAVDPSLWWEDELMTDRLEELFKTDVSTYLYVSSRGPRERDAGHERFVKLLVERAPKSTRWIYEVLDGEDHGSVVHRSVYRGLEQYFDHYPLEEP